MCDEERGGSIPDECGGSDAEERGGSDTDDCGGSDAEESGSCEDERVESNADELRGSKKELELGSSITDEPWIADEDSEESVSADSSSTDTVPSAGDVDSPLQPSRASATSAPAETKPIDPL